MNKCLVTTLEGTVNNDTLPLFGYVKLVIDNTDNDSVYSPTIKGTSENPSTVKVISGTTYSDLYCTIANPSEFTITSSSQRLSVKAGESATVLLPKYQLASLGAGTVSGEYLETSFDDYGYSNISMFKLYRSTSPRNNVYGSIETFVERQATFRPTGDTIQLTWSFTKISLHNNYHKQAYMPTTITFNEDTVTVQGANYPSSGDNTVLATYNKVTGVWTYHEGV